MDLSWGFFDEETATPLVEKQSGQNQVPDADDEEAEETTESGFSSHYLICLFSSQQYAFPIHYIRELLEPKPVKRLPKMHPGIIGLVTIRGIVCPLIEVSEHLQSQRDEGKPREETRGCMVVCEVDRRTFCFHVDAAQQVAAFDEFKEPIKPFGTEGSPPTAISHIGHFQSKPVFFVKMRDVIPA